MVVNGGGVYISWIRLFEGKYENDLCPSTSHCAQHPWPHIVGFCSSLTSKRLCYKEYVHGGQLQVHLPFINLAIRRLYYMELGLILSLSNSNVIRSLQRKSVQENLPDVVIKMLFTVYKKYGYSMY